MQIRSLALFLILLALAGCTQPPSLEAILGREFTLTEGDEALLEGEKLNVRFDSVVEDTRCPPNVSCVWQGNARIRLRLVKAPEGERLIELNTAQRHDPKEGGNYPAIGTYSGYRVRLLRLSSKPEYEAQLLVTKGE